MNTKFGNRLCSSYFHVSLQISKSLNFSHIKILSQCGQIKVLIVHVTTGMLPNIFS